MLIADQGMQIDIPERDLVHEMQPIIIIRATQKKMISKLVISTEVG